MISGRGGNRAMNTMAPKNIIVSCLTLLIPIYVGRVQEIVPFLSNLSIAKVAVIVTLILYFLSIRNYQEQAVALSSIPQVRYVAILLVLMFLSIPDSVWPGKSFDFVFSFYLKMLIFLFLIIKCTLTIYDLKKLCWSLAITIGFVALVALISPNLVEYGRVSTGETYDPNDLALVLVMSMPLFFYMSETESGWRKYFLLAIVLLCMVMVPRTGSRGGVLALAAVILAIFRDKGIAQAVKFVPAVALIGLFVIIQTPQEHLDRFMTLRHVGQDYNMTVDEGRIAVWKRGLALMMDNPVLGAGAGTFVVAEGKMKGGGKWSSAHNSFIQIGVELGVIALVMQLFLIKRMVAAGRNDVCPWLGKGLEVGAYGYIVGGFFLSWAYAYLFYLYVGLSIALVKLTTREQNSN